MVNRWEPDEALDVVMNSKHKAQLSVKHGRLVTDLPSEINTDCYNERINLSK